MKKLLSILALITVVNLTQAQFVFTNLQPESGSVENFKNSQGITVKGKVFTTNELTGGMSILAFGENGTNRTPFIKFDRFKELRKKNQRIGYKFKAYNVGADYSPLGLQSKFDVYFIIIKMNGETEYAYTTVLNSTVR